jgi:hypothetical protein
VVHIALSLPLNSISREGIFIKTSPSECRFILKPPFPLKKELYNSKYVMLHYIFYYYIESPTSLKHIFLAKFVSKYKKNCTHISKRKKPNVMQFVKYNKHINYENFRHEKLLLYVPFERSEDTLKQSFATWEVACTLYQSTIQTNEANLTYNINPTQGDLETSL